MKYETPLVHVVNMFKPSGKTVAMKLSCKEKIRIVTIPPDDG